MSLAAAELKELSPLLDAALDLPPEQHAAWLAALPPSARRHQTMLRALLARHAEIVTGDFAPPVRALAGAALVAGEHVGPYRLVRELGSGGMGSVWLAERADALVVRQVALKLPHLGWAPGLAERFARERAILATLEHPHIARLYDVGLDEQGRPYMALEYVDGEPIDAYCEHHGLDIESRLALLLQVADAVASAHARLVVHRDLKPANILVTPAGQVRLLDFGIAKLMEGDAVAATELTRAGGRALTLPYASPEQVRGEPISTVSDIYSLGVVAFELLAGVRPYRLERGGAAELEEAILTQELPSASALAAAPALRQRLRGDLDAILGKALQKDPARRYATVDALAQDWRRHLEGQRVFARRDTWLLRLWRLARRHRMPLAAAALAAAAFGLALGVGATAVVILVLLAGLAASTWQARRAREQARIAQVEARTAQAVQDFLEGIFRASSGDQVDPLAARQRTATDLLDAGAARIERELDDAPQAKLRVLKTLADMYEGMHAMERAAELHSRRAALAQRVSVAGSSEELHALSSQAKALVNLERLDDAAAALQRAKTILEARPDHTADARIAYYMASAWHCLRFDIRRGLEACDQALALLRLQPPSKRLVNALYHRASLLQYAGRNAERLVAAKEALRLIEAQPSLGQGLRAVLLLEAADAQAGEGDLASAEQAFREAIVVSDRTHGSGSMMAALARLWLARFFRDFSRPRDAKTTYLGELAIVDAAPQSRERDSMARTAISELSWVQVKLGHLAEAHSLLARREAANAERDQDWIWALGLKLSRVALDIEWGNFTAAEEGARRAGELIELHSLRGNPLNRNRYGPLLVKLHALQGDAAGAVLALSAWLTATERPQPLAADDHVGLHASALAALSGTDAASAARLCERGLESLAQHPQRAGLAEGEAALLALLGRALLAQGEPANALEALQRAQAMQHEIFDPERSPALAWVQIDCGHASLRAGDRAAALAWLESARAIHARHEVLGPQHTQALRALEAALAA